jgi:nicotinamidase-related amidase
MSRALVVIDVQRGFDDPVWGRRDNPACEANVGALVADAQAQGDHIVLVRHDSTTPGSPLRPGTPGNAFKPVLDGVVADLVVAKSVHSAFGGDVDLHAWFGDRGVDELVLCGIQTNRCCETTARVAGDRGYAVRFALDATHTFEERAADGEGTVAPETFARVTATNLHGHFATVCTTAELLAGR